MKFPGQPTLKVRAHPYPPTVVHLAFEMSPRNEGLLKKNSICKNCNMISNILVKSKAKLVLLQNLGEPMGWPGWPVATALLIKIRIN